MLFTVALISICVLFALIDKFIRSQRKALHSSNEEINVDKSFEPMIKRANAKFLVKEYITSVAIVDEILRLDPNNYNALIIRAHGLAALNYHLDAIADYEHALTINNSDANIYGLLGLSYRAVGNLEAGQVKLKIALDKGLKTYEANYLMFESLSDSTKQKYIEKTRVPNNLKRRDKEKFLCDLSEVSAQELKHI